MDLETIKLVGTILSAVATVITLGEKFFGYGKRAYLSLKKSRIVSFAAQQLSGNKKACDVELKPKTLKKILTTSFERNNQLEIPLDSNFDMIVTDLPLACNYIQSAGRVNRY